MESTSVDTLLKANEQLQQQLNQERELREQAEDERLKIKRARDELAKTVLALEYRVLEAEDEAAKLLKEVETLREASVEPLKASSIGTSAPAAAAASEIEKALRSDLEILLKELDTERKASAKLLKVVESAQNEASKVAEKLVAAEKTIRLIEALDTQAAESERLGIENTALAAAVAEARAIADLWEAQAQEALTQSNNLKDLLEESAQWSSSSSIENQVSEEGASGASADAAHSKAAEAKCRELENKFFIEQARCASLEVQVRSLCAELTRVVADSAALHRAAQPLLSDVEMRLSALLKTRVR
ncbi:hypothetical protein Ndes2437B_g03965 [Nannochloris sp. 'desiccata']